MAGSRSSVIDPSAAAALGGSFRRADESIPPSSRGGERQRAARALSPPPAEALARLHAAQAEHPFWRNRLLRACEAGALTKADYAVVFSQYYLYSQSFTRYLAALMANCEGDRGRARLAENIWEEGGGLAHDERHAEIFRSFLRGGLLIDPDDIDFLDATRFFAREYLDFCMRAHPAAGSAFLSLGTEGIVPRMYAVFLAGLSAAGVPEEHTRFFRLHMESDDAHAATLEQIMTSYCLLPDWHAICQRAMSYALDLRARFFEQLFDAVQANRISRILGRIQRGEALASESPDPAALVFRAGARGEALYANAEAREDLDFSVERVPFATEVFDTRVLRIAPGKHNEPHKHPHESVFHVISGKGRVHVNRTSVAVAPGDVVFVPRWTVHFTESAPDEPLVILAITDFGLTDRAYIGDHIATTRRRGAQTQRVPSTIPPTSRSA